MKPTYFDWTTFVMHYKMIYHFTEMPKCRKNTNIADFILGNVFSAFWDYLPTVSHGGKPDDAVNAREEAFQTRHQFC
jgi:hypothetical protein